MGHASKILPGLTWWIRRFRQALDQMIHAQPQRPCVMVKRQRKNNRNHKQDCENRRIAQVCENKAGEISDENKDFSGDHVRHDCADKEAFLAFEDRAARPATMFQIKRSPHDRVATAHRTAQFEAAPESKKNCTAIAFHNAEGGGSPTVREGNGRNRGRDMKLQIRNCSGTCPPSRSGF